MGSKKRAVAASGGLSPTQRFLLVFAVLFGLMEAFIWLVAYQEPVFRPYGALNSKICAFLLTPFLDHISSSGTSLSWGAYPIDIRAGCDSFQASAVLLAGILAFPASWKQRLIGAAIGLPVLFFLNVARLILLLILGRKDRELFETMHLEVMPAVFVLAALLIWLLWAVRIPPLPADARA